MMGESMVGTHRQELNTSDLLDTPFVRAIMSSSCMGTAAVQHLEEIPTGRMYVGTMTYFFMGVGVGQVQPIPRSVSKCRSCNIIVSTVLLSGWEFHNRPISRVLLYEGANPTRASKNHPTSNYNKKSPVLVHADLHFGASSCLESIQVAY